MEAAAILHMLRNSAVRGFIVGSIVSDEDSVMREHLRYLDPTNKKVQENYKTGFMSLSFLGIRPIGSK